MSVVQQPATLRLVPLDRAAYPRWDRFVTEHPEGTFFHRAGWQAVIERAFGYRTYYAYAERNGAVTGILPLVHVKSWLFGDALVSTAFCVYGGPLAQDEATERLLRSHAVGEMERLGCRRLEFRFRAPTASGWPSDATRYATFRRAIDADPDANLLAVPRKQRAVIRKSLAGNLQAEPDDVDRLHRIYGESVRNLGTPVLPRTYFRALAEEFADCAESLTVFDGRHPTAAVLSFFFRDEVLPYYGGGTREARASGANDFMYWEVMRRAGARGCRMFDFGRSKVGTGAYHFKKNWGFVPEPLVYEYRVRPGESPPDTSPLNPKLQRYINVWKRLPLAVTNVLGPPLVRHLGLGA